VSPTWHNHSGTQSCKPRAIVKPGSLQELIDLVRKAEHEQTTVRAVGAGHAWSDVALTDGYLIEPDNLSGVTQLDDTHVRVGGGTHIHTLNDALDRMGLALTNMGGYDAQTIAGVISTSTHGSGLNWAPFPDMVRSLDVVVSKGRAYRLEPKSTPFTTDAQSFNEPPLELVQDDDRFWAAVCGMGTLGLIHSAVLEVREKFWLKEVRTLSSWEKLRDTLTADGALGKGDHYELFVNPYARWRRHRLLVTERSNCKQPAGPPEDRFDRHPLTEIESSFFPLWWIFRLLARHWPWLLAKGFNSVLKGMRDKGYRAVSYKVFNIGEANHLPAYSMELGVSLEGNRHLDAVDQILKIAKQRKKQGMYHTSPIALRFVAPSKALASMMYEQPTMMIELILVTDTNKGDELLAGYQEALIGLGARPHWGQYNMLTPADVAALYPKSWDRWLALAGDFNSSGVFDSEFTRRLGIP
jgi:hypothetical protein